jgi:hypothetical protein
MIGKLIGAIAGSQVAKHVRGVDGTAASPVSCDYGGADLDCAAGTLCYKADQYAADRVRNHWRGAIG